MVDGIRDDGQYQLQLVGLEVVAELLPDDAADLPQHHRDGEASEEHRSVRLRVDGVEHPLEQVKGTIE